MTLDSSTVVVTWTCTAFRYLEITMMSKGPFPQDGGQPMDVLRRMMGPTAVDQMIRQAITTCWAAMPDEKRNVSCVEAEVRRMVDRALEDLRADASAFGGA